MMALLHRNISEELLREVERRRQRFDLQQEPSRALGSESSLVISPSQLLERLKRFPMEPPLTADRAEEMVCAMENELKALSSPVIDVSLPPVGSDPRMVVVGDTHGQLQDVLHILEENGPPSEEVAYLFNGDIVDRGRHAVEIWMLIIAYKLAYPKSVYVLRGNHENDQMIARPFKMGGGFTEECLSKYNHRVLAAFQRMFKLLPLFGVVEQEIFVVHGGLFRSPGVTLESLRTLPEADWQRNYPNPLKKDDMDRGKVWTRNEEILFDALWADPHMGLGSKRSERGRVAVLFGHDVTHGFLDDAGLALCLRSHRVPQNGGGYEVEHGGRLMTLFSASKYGGVLQNRGAVAVLRRRSEGAPAFLASSKLEDKLIPPLRHLQMTMSEFVVPALKEPSERNEVTQACVQQVRRFVETTASQHQQDIEQYALALICVERRRLWSQLRARDEEGRGLLSSDDLCEVLAEVCGELDWHALLQCVAPSLGADVDYGEFLAAPSVRWFHLGIAHMVTVARASAQAELKLSGLAALFDSPNGTVTHDLASEALGRLLPSLRERQRHQLAKSLFGEETTQLSAVLHQLALFADPPELSEPWMRQALHRIGDLIRQRHGPPPLHSALIRFFKAAAHRQSDLLGPKEFVEGLQHLGTYECRDPDVPLLHAGRLYQLFEAIDSNQSGTVSFLELLLAMDERSERPELPKFPALTGVVPATLMVHKAALLRVCRALDPLDTGRLSVKNFVELVAALFQALGRPLAAAERRAIDEELKGEDLAYPELLRSFEAHIDGDLGSRRMNAESSFTHSDLAV